MADFNTVLTEAKDFTIPSEKEKQQLQETAATLKEKAEESLIARGYTTTPNLKSPEVVTITQTGSTARGTWVAGDRDIDLFLEFPPTTSTETLESVGLEVGEEILEESQRDFASHPYTKGEFNGFDIDVVPCFAVESASDIKSAVDRTPFHTRFLREELSDSQCDEVRLAKKFMKGVGVYGSDVATQGFSGYLTELLILEYGDFKGLLKNASEWSFPTRIDVGNTNSDASFPSEFVVIDPTDPDRNVAANLSIEKATEFQYLARRFLENPQIDFFNEKDPLSQKEIENQIRSRGTDFISISLEKPDGLVEDTFLPQLMKVEESLKAVLSSLDFTVVNTFAGMTDEEGLIVIELETARLPPMKKREGPPVEMEEATANFVEALPESAHGPFIEGNRIVARCPREFSNAVEFLKSDEFFDRVSIGANLTAPLKERDVFEPNTVYILQSKFSEIFGEMFAELPR